MIKIKESQIFINGESKIILSGEIHYYRQKKENWQNFYNELLEKGVQVDVLINNAGFMLPFTKFDNLTDLEIDEIIKTNFVSVVNSTKIFMPMLKKSTSPALVNIASSAGLCAVVGQSMYCATKSAVKGFTETLQQDYKGQISVVGIYPGFIRTDILSRQKPEATAPGLLCILSQ